MKGVGGARQPTHCGVGETRGWRRWALIGWNGWPEHADGWASASPSLMDYWPGYYVTS